MSYLAHVYEEDSSFPSTLNGRFQGVVTDRTRGAIRRDVPKPRQVIDELAEGTGGRVFPISDPRAAASDICDELRKHRYVLSYLPQSVPFTESRRLLLIGEKGIEARAKTMQPAN